MSKKRSAGRPDANELAFGKFSAISFKKFITERREESVFPAPCGESDVSFDMGIESGLKNRCGIRQPWLGQNGTPENACHPDHARQLCGNFSIVITNPQLNPAPPDGCASVFAHDKAGAPRRRRTGFCRWLEPCEAGSGMSLLVKIVNDEE